MSKRENLLAIDYVKGASSGGTSRVVSGGGGTVDTTNFLLRDGTRSMLANFDVGGFSITNVNLVDGIDIAAHAANPNAHHARQHSYDSTSDHTGTLSWSNVDKTGSNLTEIEIRNHSALFFIGPDDHHNRQHSITSSSDHTATGSNFDLVGLTATDTLGILTPSANVASGIERILKSSSTGNLNLASLTTTLINSGSGATLEIAPGNYLVLNPAGYLIQLTSGRAIQSDNYNSRTTGMRIDQLGGGDFRYLYSDEMHAKAFVADLEQALAGGQIISKSVAVLYYDFTAPAPGGSTTLVVEDLPGTTTMPVFQDGDIVRLRNFSRSGGGLSITDCWGVVTFDTTYGTSGFDSNTKTQRYTFVRSSGSDAGAMATSTTVASKSLVLDYGTTGNGYYEVNAIDGAYAVNSPYAQVVNWTTHPATGKTTRTRLGNLVGIFGGTNEYGLYAGDGGTATSSQYLRISNAGVGLFNVPLRMYTGGTETVHIGGWNDVWLGPSSSDKRMSFDGSTLTINAVVTIQAGSAGYGNLSGIPTSLANINSTEGSKLSGIATGATKNTVYRQSTQPAINNGDLWYNTDTKVWYQCVSGAWQVAGNYVTDTTELNDGANLGQTANWNNLSSLPTRFSFETTPTGQAAQLFLAANAMGYWDGTNWRTYFDNAGQMVLRGASGAYVVWNGSTLFGGTSTSSASAKWYIDSTNGDFVAAAGNLVMNSGGLMLGTSNIGNSAEYLQFNAGELGIGVSSSFAGYRTASFYAKSGSSNQVALLVRNAGDANAANYNAGIFVRQISYAGSIRLEASNIYFSTTSGGNTVLSITGSLSASTTISASTISATSSLTAPSASLTSVSSSSVTATNITGTTMVSSSYILAGTSTIGAYQLDVTGEAHVTGSIRADVALSLKPTTPPATSAVYAVVFVDSADGDLKVKFNNNVTRTLAVN